MLTAASRSTMAILPAAPALLAAAIAVLLSTAAPRAAAQGWLPSVSGTTTRLEHVATMNALNAVAVGLQGTLLRSSSGGTAWELRPPPTVRDLYTAAFQPFGALFIGGAQGVLLSSFDFASTFSPRQSGTTATIHAIRFVSADSGYICGSDGMLRATANAGQSWEYRATGTFLTLRGVAFRTRASGVACGDSGIILRTVDAGATWQPVQSNTQRVLHAVDFSDSLLGAAVGARGMMLRTTTGGASWFAVYAGTQADLYDIRFIGAGIGYATGAAGTILRSTDNGATWTQQQSGVTATLTSADFSDLNAGLVAGTLGTILRTTNGGIPVRLASFTAHAGAAGVTLRWSTEEERGCASFTVERRCPGDDAWLPAATLPGAGTTTRRSDYRVEDVVGCASAARPPCTGTAAPAGTSLPVTGPDARCRIRYRLVQHDFDGSSAILAALDIDAPPGEAPASPELDAPVPQPARDVVTLRWRMDAAGRATVRLFALDGRPVAVPYDGEAAAGAHVVAWRMAHLASGTYVCTLTTERGTRVRRFALTR